MRITSFPTFQYSVLCVKCTGIVWRFCLCGKSETERKKSGAHMKSVHKVSDSVGAMQEKSSEMQGNRKMPPIYSWKKSHRNFSHFVNCSEFEARGVSKYGLLACVIFFSLSLLLILFCFFPERRKW